MKFLLSLLAGIFISLPTAATGYHVESAEECESSRWSYSQLTAAIGGVLMGEKPFLSIFLESGDELIMFPDSDEALNFFRQNQGKKARVTFYEGHIFWPDDPGAHGPGNCDSAYFFQSGKVIE